MADWVNGAQAITQGFGTGKRVFKNDVAISNTATTTDTLTPAIGIRSGYFHFRTKSVDASATTAIKVSVGDGSSTLVLVPTTPATAAGDVVDYLFPFCNDISGTTFTFVITVGGTTKTLTYDAEIIGAE